MSPRSCLSASPTSSVATRTTFTSTYIPPPRAAGVQVSAQLNISRRSASAAAIASVAPLGMMFPGSLDGGATRGSVAAAATSSLAGAVAGSPSNLDLLVVGPGVLGSVLGRDWLASVQGGTATGLTNTDRSHERLRAMGLTPATRSTLPPNKKYSFVAFTAPPSGSEDYVADIKSALALWDGTGSFIFTSSMSVCAVDDGGSATDEHCPLVPMGAGPSTDKLRGAEEAVLAAGGNVLRLVGLYHKFRGAHTFFIKQGTVARPGGYVVNLLHYEDAAALAAAILRGDGSGPFRGRAFLGTDGHPVTFADMVEYCFAGGAFERVPVSFTGTFPDGGKTGRGKRVDNSGTSQALGGWKPKYESFQSFMAAGGADYYNTSGLKWN